MSGERGWSAQDVHAAARAWVWVPDDALRFRADGLDVVGYPDHFAMPTQVLPRPCEGEADALVERAREVARGWGRDTLFWWVSSDSPAGITEALTRRGAVLTEEAAVLALEIGQGVPDLAVPSAVSVRLVDDERAVRDSEAVSAQAFETSPTPEARLASILDEERRSWADRSGFRSLAYLDGEPVATGGCTMAEQVARLWGAGAHPQHRGRGGYRAVLDHRLRLARELGATLALVKGRVATSGPILRRAGFDAYGVERCFALTV